MGGGGGDYRELNRLYNSVYNVCKCFVIFTGI